MVDQDAMEELIELWEPADCEVIRTIDGADDTVERIIKFSVKNDAGIFAGMRYSLFRYFTLGDVDTNVFVSVDLQGVDADHIIQVLAERL